MYSLYDYGSMIGDKGRTEPYIAALRRTVRPGSIVVDIGTGTGYFAVLACQFGARKVYAIESDDLIEVGREIARTNGLSNKIEFIQNVSTRVTLPEKADVIVSDLHGVLPMFGQGLLSLADARERFLAPDGIMIPMRDTLFGALVSDQELYAKFAGPWESDTHGLDMRPARVRALNSLRKQRLSSKQLITSPRQWLVIDYRSQNSPIFCGDLQWTLERDVVAHGFALWFDSELSEGIGYSSAPGQPEIIYGQTFFPFLEPLQLSEGSTVSITLRASLVGDDYTWSWDSNISHANAPIRNLRQSTFLGTVFSPDQLRKRNPDFRPTLNETGEIEQLVLSRMHGRTDTRDIASELLGRFPSRFNSSKEALDYVTEMVVRCSR